MGICTSEPNTPEAQRYRSPEMQGYRGVLRAAHPSLDVPPEPVPPIDLVIRTTPTRTPSALKDPFRPKLSISLVPVSFHPLTATPKVGYTRSPPVGLVATSEPNTSISASSEEAAQSVAFVAVCPPSNGDAAPLARKDTLPFLDTTAAAVHRGTSPLELPQTEAPVVPPRLTVTAVDGVEGDPAPTPTPPPLSDSFSLSPHTGESCGGLFPRRAVKFTLDGEPVIEKHSPLVKCKRPGPSRHISPGATPMLAPKRGPFVDLPDSPTDEDEGDEEMSGLIPEAAASAAMGEF